MPSLLPLVLFAGVTVTVLLLSLLLRGLGRLLPGRKQTPTEEPEPALVRAVAARGTASWRARLDRAFADMVHRTMLGLGTGQAVGVMLLAGVALGAVLYFWRDDVVWAAAGLAVGPLLPLGVFLFLQGRWRRQLQQQLPDSFLLLARSLRAGLSMDQAIAFVGKQGLAPVSLEFQRVAEQLKLGLTVPVALEGMAARLRLSDVNVLRSVVNLHQRVGGNLSALLDRLAAVVRDRNQYRGQLRAATALGRATAFVLALASPALLGVYWLLQPQYLTNFVQTTQGVIALLIAGVLEVVGVLWIFYLLRVEE